MDGLSSSSPALLRWRPRCQMGIVLLAGFLLTSYFLFFHRLGDRDLWSSHEARAAQDAQTILSDGSWGLPHLFDRRADLQKPPLYYWFVACIARCRGETRVDAWAVRLPAAVGGFATVLVVGLIAFRRARPVAGLTAATMLATALHFTWLARIGRIDMPLAFTVTLALGSFYLAYCGRGGRESRAAGGWLLVTYLSIAAGVMLKGPIGLVLPLVVGLAFLLSEGGLPRPSNVAAWLRLAHVLGLWWGVPLTLALTLPWFLWANAATGGEFFRVFVWKHNLDRGFGGEGTLAAHPWWFYGPRFAFDFLPWSALLPVLGWLMWRRRLWRDDPEARFGFLWFAAVIALLSCMRFKRADYLLPAYPGAALFLGCSLERCWQARLGVRRMMLATAGVMAAAALGWWFFLGHVLPAREPARECRRFAEAIRRHAPAPNLVLFFRAENHALAFHVGRPIDTLLEWENLDWWAGRPDRYYVVMPPENAAEWAEHLQAGELQEVLRTTDLPGSSPERALVLMRTLSRTGPPPP